MGNSTKLQPRYWGPVKVYEVLPNDTNSVRNLNEEEPEELYATTAHVSQLKIWQPNQDDDDAEEVPASGSAGIWVVSIALQTSLHLSIMLL